MDVISICRKFINFFLWVGLSCRIKANWMQEGPGPVCGGWGLSALRVCERGESLREFRRETTENFERLG